MATKPKMIPAVKVTSRSPRGSFWRAGREWSAEPTTVPVSELTKDQLAAVRAESMLVVENTELPVPDGADATTGE